jgi:hypothetical protein
MRTFYLFFINKEIMNNYTDKEIYESLENIYYMNTNNVKEAYKLFDYMIQKINKDLINNLLKSIYIDNINYINYRYSHIINDFLKGESSKLEINNTYIKIKSSIMVPSFLLDFKNIKNIFVCDFTSSDYFYLKEIVNNKKSCRI